MAVMRARARSTTDQLAEAMGSAGGDGGGVLVPTMAAGGSQKPIVRPELEYFLFLVGVLVAGALLAFALDGGAEWQAPAEISAFAVIFVMTQAIERLLEIFAPFFGTTDGGGAHGVGRITKSQALRRRDEALARVGATGDAAKLQEAAWAHELVEQIRANTSTLWAVGAALGMVAAGQMGILLLHLLQVPDVSRQLDVVVTGLVIGGGTKALHELIKGVQAKKEEAQRPQGA